MPPEGHDTGFYTADDCDCTEIDTDVWEIEDCIIGKERSSFDYVNKPVKHNSFRKLSYDGDTSEA